MLMATGHGGFSGVALLASLLFAIYGGPACCVTASGASPHDEISGISG